jgi:AAA+ superfamily predicted ATPase
MIGRKETNLTSDQAQWVRFVLTRHLLALFLLFTFMLLPLSRPVVLAQSEYTFSPLTPSAWTSEVGTTIEFGGQLSPVPPLSSLPEKICIPYCNWIQLETEEIESQVWKEEQGVVVGIGTSVLTAGAANGEFMADGHFTIRWTPQSSGKYMVRATLKTLDGSETVLAVSPPIGWIDVRPIYLAGLVPFFTLQSWWNFIAGGGAISMLTFSSLIYISYHRRKSRRKPSTEPLRTQTTRAPKYEEKIEEQYEEVGGLVDVKAALAEAIELPLHRPDLFQKYHVVPPTKGLLLYGPPGCGKTLLARSIAAKGKIVFIYSRSTDIFTKYYGESASRVRELFGEAREKAPCVLFFDEIDALVPIRGMVDAGTEREDVRVTSEFLAQMDGLSPLEKVIIVGATNRPEAIDSAILRPGRFDKILYVPPPDVDGRLAILKRNMQGVPMADDVDLRDLAVQTERYSGADIVALCRESKMSAMKAEVGGAERPVLKADFVRAINLVRPSIDQAVIARYELFAKNFRKSQSDPGS